MSTYTCPLRTAVAQGDPEQVQQQLSDTPPQALHNTAGPRTRTVLHEAVWAGSIDVVRQLLAAGACVHTRDAQEWTALALAAVRGFADIAELLLQHGADPSTQDLSGRTPLHFTARSGSAAVAKHLLDHGALVAAVDYSNRTALHDAASRGAEDLVSLLLAHAYDPVAVSMQIDKQHMVPLQCAAHRGHEAVVKQLLPAVLQAAPSTATALIQSAAVAAARSSYTQVAVMLVKELGRIGPLAVANFVKQLPDAPVDSCRGAMLAAIVLQWVADCADMPLQQEQLQREQQEVDVARHKVQGLCLAVAGLKHELQETDAWPATASDKCTSD